MRHMVAAVLVLCAALPACGRELMTKGPTPVREQPDKDSRVLAELPRNVKLASDQTKDFWFHISATVDGKAVSGWVNQTDVETLMGRSKGQLLDENKRLYDELVELRKAKRELQQKLEDAEQKLEKAAAEKTELEKGLNNARADLDGARKEVSRLEAALKKALERKE